MELIIKSQDTESGKSKREYEHAGLAIIDLDSDIVRTSGDSGEDTFDNNVNMFG